MTEYAPCNKKVHAVHSFAEFMPSRQRSNAAPIRIGETPTETSGRLIRIGRAPIRTGGTPIEVAATPIEVSVLLIGIAGPPMGAARRRPDSSGH